MLEVETRDFSGPRAFDLCGIPLHEDNETVIKERIFLDKADPNLLHDQMTVEDHALTRPWTVMKSYRRSAEARPQWHEYICAWENKTMKIGDETYLISNDGYPDAGQEGSVAAELQVLPGAVIRPEITSPSRPRKRAHRRAGAGTALPDFRPNGVWVPAFAGTTEAE